MAAEVRTGKRRLLDLWLALPFHWVVLLVLLALVIVAYWGTHEWGRPKYLASTRPVLVAASEALAITSSGAELRLTFKGNKLEHTEAASVLRTEFLGVGGTPAVLGIVHKHRTWVDQFNQRLAGIATDLLTHASRDDAFVWQIPLDLVSASTEQRLLRPTDIRRRLSEGALTPNDYLLLVDAMLTGSLVTRTRIEPTLAVQPENVVEPRLAAVRNGLERIAQEFPSLIRDAQPERGVETVGPIDATTEAAIRAWARRPFHAAAELLAYVRVPGESIPNGATTPSDSPEQQKDRLRAELDKESLHVLAATLAKEANIVLQQNLVQVLQVELGEMWFFGRYKWCEIAFWTIFGVLIMGLADLGFASARGRRMRDGAMWQPRETFRVVGRMAYAPFLTIGFLWLAVATPLLEGYDFLASSTFGILAFAFLVGFVPNALLDRLQRTLFALLGREDKVAGANPANLPKTSVVTRHVGANQLPSIDDLQAHLTEIATAPLR